MTIGSVPPGSASPDNASVADLYLHLCVIQSDETFKLCLAESDANSDISDLMASH